MDADLRCQVEEIFQSTLADTNGLLERESCIDFLQSIGGTKQEANALLKEYDQQEPHISVKDFLDILCGPSKAAEATETAAGKEVPQLPVEPVEPLKEEPATIEEPVIDPAPVESREPATIEEPVIDPAPVESQEPATIEEPVIDPAPVESQEPVIDPAPVESQEPATIEEPVIDPAPVESQEPATVEEPVIDPAPVESQTEAEPVELPKEEEPPLEITATTAGTAEVTEDDSMATPERTCDMCGEKTEVTQDPTDLGWYCEECWVGYYGAPPCADTFSFLHTNRLVKVKDGHTWKETDLLSAWNAHPIPKWPPRMPPCGPVNPEAGDPTNIGDAWVPVHIHVNPGLVGQWARQCTREYRPYPGEILCKKYKIEHAVGAGHFTRAYLATDIESNTKVCIKRHGGLTVELMTDLLTISRRIESVDPECKIFSRLIEAFFDMVGYTVETLIEGRNCMEMCRTNHQHFKDMANLRTVAIGCLRGLDLLCQAGVVHCDMKADNFMWTKGPDGNTVVRIVDFGCSRLDSRLENGRNWAFAEGGAGHIGKWAPEMMLRLPITDKADVWGHAVALLELYSGRNMWNEEEDTVEYMLAQALGLVNEKAGLPEKLLRRSPLDIRQLYTPSPAYFPVQRLGVAPNVRFKELRPATWGLACVLGDETKWDNTKKQLSAYVLRAMKLDPEDRPHAVDLMDEDFLNPELGEPVSA